MEIRRHVHTVLGWRWSIPSWCAVCATIAIADTVYLGMTGVMRDVQVFVAGGLMAFAVLDILMVGRIKRYERRSIERLLSPEQQGRMQRQMVEAGERALAEMRGRNPDVHIEGGFIDDGDPGVRH